MLGFLNTTRSFPKIPEEVRGLPKKSEVFRRRPKSAEGEVIEKTLIHKISSEPNSLGLPTLSYDRIDLFYLNGDHTTKMKFSLVFKWLTPESKPVVPLDWCPLKRENKSSIVLAV